MWFLQKFIDFYFNKTVYTFIPICAMKNIIAPVCFMIVISSCFAPEPLPWQVTFQPLASPIMEALHHFYNFLLYISTAVVLLVAVLLGYRSNLDRSTYNNFSYCCSAVF